MEIEREAAIANGRELRRSILAAVVVVEAEESVCTVVGVVFIAKPGRVSIAEQIEFMALVGGGALVSIKPKESVDGAGWCYLMTIQEERIEGTAVICA